MSTLEELLRSRGLRLIKDTPRYHEAIIQKAFDEYHLSSDEQFFPLLQDYLRVLALDSSSTSKEQQPQKLAKFTWKAFSESHTYKFPLLNICCLLGWYNCVQLLLRQSPDFVVVNPSETDPRRLDAFQAALDCTWAPTKTDLSVYHLVHMMLQERPGDSTNNEDADADAVNSPKSQAPKPLFYAVVFNFLLTARLLLANGAISDRVSQGFGTPLAIAVSYGNVEMAVAIMTSSQFNGCHTPFLHFTPPLHIAVQQNDVSMVEAFLRLRSNNRHIALDLEEEDRYERTAVVAAPGNHDPALQSVAVP